MNKPMSQAEIDQVIGITLADKPVMTRRQKLLRLAEVVRAHHGPLYIFHNLEHWHRSDLENQPATLEASYLDSYGMHTMPTAFALAAADPVLAGAGYTSGATIAETMRFFELSQHELHEFSCNCGGEITSDVMASRIDYLAR
jgi:hypothetical protein